MSQNYIYLFNEGNEDMRDLLGGKGANLSEMTNLGLHVPQGFIITTEACTKFNEDEKEINSDIKDEVMEYISKLEKITGKKFGNYDNPLLLSIRSSSKVIVPCLADAVLNLGLNDEIVENMALNTGNHHWAWDCYRRFIKDYSEVVMEDNSKFFQELTDRMKLAKGIKADNELTVADLKELIKEFKENCRFKIGKEFPSNPVVQLFEAIKAVFKSWDNEKAEAYRKENNIPYSWGVAVIVQSMVFGNLSDNCGTGIAFTRDPATGSKEVVGEYLTNAQGEDVVAGVCLPMPVKEMRYNFPDIFLQLKETCQKLENHYKNMLDVEFTVEQSRLYVLQSRIGKRTAEASIKIACDFFDEGVIKEKEAVDRVDPNDIETFLRPVFDKKYLKQVVPLEKAMGVSIGAVCGKIALSVENAETWSNRNEIVIFAKTEMTEEDENGMRVAQGILTARAGRTSHAAIFARKNRKCCIVGCTGLIIDENRKVFKIGNKSFREGDIISIDGATGCIYEGSIPIVKPEISENLARIMKWANEYGMNPRRKIESYEIKRNESVTSQSSINQTRDYSSTNIDPIKKDESFMDKIKKLFK